MIEVHCPILEELSQIWENNLRERYGESFPLINEAVGRLKLIANKFYELKLNDDHFTSEILSKDSYKYEQRMSEILFSDRLIRDGYQISSKKKGPDFKAEKNGLVTWFEVITPAPEHKLALQFQDLTYGLNPTHEGTHLANLTSLLKTTQSVQEKYKKIDGYIKDKIISKNDSTVIVINDSLLFPLNDYMIGLTCEVAEGYSGLPLIVEALVGIGQCYFHPNEDNENYQIVREFNRFINKTNGSPVETNLFLTDTYKEISGVFVLTLREDYGLAEVIFEHKKSKKNRGTFLTNPNTSRPFIKENLTANYINHEHLIHILNPSDSHPTNALITKTLAGHYLDLMNYLDYIRQLYIDAGILFFDKVKNKIVVSPEALEIGVDKYQLNYDESTGYPISVTLIKE
ncbi:TPA: hypothetical protein SMP78_002619 [Proteus mirabilis]